MWLEPELLTHKQHALIARVMVPDYVESQEILVKVGEGLRNVHGCAGGLARFISVELKSLESHLCPHWFNGVNPVGAFTPMSLCCGRNAKNIPA